MSDSRPSPAPAAGRLARLREELSRREITAIALSNPTNVGYVSGFTGSTALAVVTPGSGPYAADAVFIADSRYALQAQGQCPDFRVRQCGPKPLETLAEVVKELGIRTLHFESATLTVAALEKWKEALPETTLAPAADVVETLRQVKDAGEIACIREAAGIVDRAFDFLLTITRPGVREIDLAIELEYFLKKQGSEKEAFDIIVASGPRSAMPHGRASEKRLESGEFVTFDFGACRGGYFSDLTRTIVLGKANDRQREVYGIVAAAQQAALDAIRPGATGKEVDAKARDLITARGFGEKFGHGTGHGLGRDVHDHPGFSVQSELTLAAGMVLTVEPGIYIEEWGGVRIEDDVVVTGTGCEILTSAPKHLIEL
jgi:Xaa-Pro aminopeptidase